MPPSIEDAFGPFAHDFIKPLAPLCLLLNYGDLRTLIALCRLSHLTVHHNGENNEGRDLHFNLYLAYRRPARLRSLQTLLGQAQHCDKEHILFGLAFVSCHTCHTLQR